MHYHSLGKIPPKRHTQFRKKDGTLYHEELFSTEGFSDNYSLLYHANAPTQITQVGEPYSVAPELINDKKIFGRTDNPTNHSNSCYDLPWQSMSAGM